MKYLVMAVAVNLVITSAGTLDVPANAAVHAACPPDYSAEWVSGSAWQTMDPHQVISVTESWRNVGCATWDISVSGRQAFAGTWNPTPGQDQSSPLGGSGNCGTLTNWLACNRIRPLENVVSPGTVANFDFQVKAPPAPGTYQVYLRPLIEGVVWMEDYGVHWQMTVREPRGPSRYMTTVDPATGGILYKQGCIAGGDINSNYGGPFVPQTGVVVLSLGKPVYDPGTAQYGVTLFGNSFASTTQVLEGAKAWARGFWDCSTAAPILRIALGTSNYCCQVSAAHGRAWALMVNDFKNWITASGFGSQISGAGANDIEMDWSTPTEAKNWACLMNELGSCVDGYGSVSGALYYNFGDAAGCPPAGVCNNAWTQEDVWFVSWGATPAWPLPQIYNATMAQQWQQLSLYGFTQHGARMTILGQMTQYAACQTNGPCPGTDFTPQQSWTELWKQINGDVRTRQTGASELRWSTDITWKQD